MLDGWRVFCGLQRILCALNGWDQKLFLVVSDIIYDSSVRQTKLCNDLGNTNSEMEMQYA